MTQKLKSRHLNATRIFVVQQQIFINKIHVWQVESYSQPFLIVPFTIYGIRNSLLYVRIRKVLLDFLQYQVFLSLTVLPVTILFFVKLFLISNFKLYFLMHEVLLIVSAVTPASASAQFYLFLFTVSVTYQNLLLLSLQYSYQVGFPISYPYQALLSLKSLYQQLI